MKTKKQKKLKSFKKLSASVVQLPKINLNKDQKYILLCNIVDYLGSYGITENKEISQIANILSNHDKLRGIKRSNTCYRKKHLTESRFSKMISDGPDNTVEDAECSSNKCSTSNYFQNNKKNGINTNENDVTQSIPLNNIKQKNFENEVNTIIGELVSFMNSIKFPCKVN